MFLQHSFDYKIRNHGTRALHIQRAAKNSSDSIKAVRQRAPKSFISQVRSPGHLIFFASNVALLLQVKYFATKNRQATMEKRSLRMHELENYEEVIKNLEDQENSIRHQIKILKKKNAKKNYDANHLEEHTAERSHQYRRDAFKQSYLSQRAAILSIFSKQSNIDQLFQGKEQSQFEKSSNVNEPAFQNMTHSSTILHSLMMLSNIFIKTFLVEINLRNAFNDGSVLKLKKTNYLFYQNLFQRLKLDLLKGYLNERLGLVAKDRSSSSFFWRHPDEETFYNMGTEFQHSGHFRGRELMRLDYYYHTSGKYLNYEISSKSRHILAIQAPIFYSDVESNAVYIKDFRKIFENYENDPHPMKHLNLILCIAQRLIQDGECVPQVTIFKELLDLLGKAKLHNYQALVYDTLLAFEHDKNILASSNQPHKIAGISLRRFAAIIKEDPSILVSLIQYQVFRNDLYAFKLLLEYLTPNKGELRTKPFILPAFMLSWNSNHPPCDVNLPGAFISTSVIENAIDGCIKLKDYEQIDKLLAKLVFDLVRVLEGIKIALDDQGKNVPYLSQTTPEITAIKQLFSERILLLLGKAYMESGDKLRCNWLASLISKIPLDSSSGEIEELQGKIWHFTQDRQGEFKRDIKNVDANGITPKHDRSSILLNLTGNADTHLRRARFIEVQNSVLALDS